jgi:hypothetical protein
MELSEPSAFSDLIGRPVRDGAGRHLGRIFEVRGHWEPDGSLVLDELMVGPRALWRRLRGPGAGTRGIAWENVVETGADGFVVRR